MTYDQATEELLSQWRAGAKGISERLEGQPGGSWEDARATYMDVFERLFPPPPGVTFSETSLGGVPTTVITPDHVEGNRILVYYHGGGYAYGGPRGYKGLAGHYARLLRARVYVPDYRLAPQHRFPVPIDDAFAAYRALVEQGHDPREIALSGDSAGGALVVTLMRRARDTGLALPAAGVAISPWANLAHEGASAISREGVDPVTNRKHLELLVKNFLGEDVSPTHPDASPVYADVVGLNPILIQIGENEVMLSDAVRLAQHLAESRVRVTLEVWPGMFHVWPLFQGHLKQADEALHHAVAFIDQTFADAKGPSRR